ncbi:hypothetical protein RMI87_15710 [Pseudomonas aeruginosa]|uniref:hypothetical protein n=1 Tax=Pseudomonas aeruginosa TaxID=287 RepID=UPI00287DB6B0|nr:hypothetical protein [Pseudomonas aeruginosa]MDS9914950.1 hypothetical protein [Pseudomonas aeruginosa]
MRINNRPFNRNYVILPWGVLLLTGAFSWFMKKDDSPMLPERVFSRTTEAIPAGNIAKVQLHESATSASTTLETNIGTFHVRGAVTAVIGDEVIVRKEKAGTTEKAFACVKSVVKTGCYELL